MAGAIGGPEKSAVLFHRGEAGEAGEAHRGPPLQAPRAPLASVNFTALMGGPPSRQPPIEQRQTAPVKGGGRLHTVCLRLPEGGPRSGQGRLEVQEAAQAAQDAPM